MRTVKSAGLLSCTALLIGFGISSIASTGSSDKPEWLAYAPTKVTFEGVLLKEQKYGPPNFGENPSTDRKVDIYVIRLSKPINVKGDSANDPNDPDVHSYSGVTEVQLEQVFGNGIGGFDALVGKTVRAYGTLHEKLTPGDYMDVVMDVEKIVGLPPSS